MEMVKYLNKLLGGCGVERDKLEAQGLLQQIAEEYSAGNLTDEELVSLIAKVCEGLVALAARCGRKETVENCTNTLTMIIKSEVPTGAFRSLRELLTRRRRGRRAGETATII